MIATALPPEAGSYNWLIFLLERVRAILLLVYRWLKPLLPAPSGVQEA